MRFRCVMNLRKTRTRGSILLEVIRTTRQKDNRVVNHILAYLDSLCTLSGPNLRCLKLAFHAFQFQRFTLPLVLCFTFLAFQFRTFAFHTRFSFAFRTCLCVSYTFIAFHTRLRFMRFCVCVFQRFTFHMVRFPRLRFKLAFQFRLLQLHMRFCVCVSKLDLCVPHQRLRLRFGRSTKVSSL